MAVSGRTVSKRERSIRSVNVQDSEHEAAPVRSWRRRFARFPQLWPVPSCRREGSHAPAFAGVTCFDQAAQPGRLNADFSIDQWQ